MRWAGWLVVATALAGCGDLSSLEYDSSDPAQCLAIFRATSMEAMGLGNQPLAREMAARQKTIIDKQGGRAWLDKVAPQTRALAERLQRERNTMALEKLLRGCLERHAPAA